MKDLLIVDLEATCFQRGEEPADFVSEIIEIGAVVFDTIERHITGELQVSGMPGACVSRKPGAARSAR